MCDFWSIRWNCLILSNYIALITVVNIKYVMHWLRTFQSASSWVQPAPFFLHLALSISHYISLSYLMPWHGAGRIPAPAQPPGHSKLQWPPRGLATWCIGGISGNTFIHQRVVILKLSFDMLTKVSCILSTLSVMLWSRCDYCWV